MNRNTWFLALALLGVCAIPAHAPPTPANGFVVCAEVRDQRDPKIVSDDAGGMYIAWTDHRGTNDFVYAQRVDGSRRPYWVDCGILVCGEPREIVTLVRDGFGGAIVILLSSDEIWAQRIGPAGTLLWGTDGVHVWSSGSVDNVVAVSDNAGGAIVCWEQDVADVLAQKLDAAGNEVWPMFGVQMIDPVPPTDDRDPALVYDGSGGVLIVARVDGDIHVQRIYASGSKWSARGTQLNELKPGTLLYPAITSDGAGGAYVAWQEYITEDNILAAHVDAGGATGGSRVVVCGESGNQQYPDIIADGHGNAVVCWEDHRDSHADVYAQKIDPFSQTLWTSGGVEVCTEEDHDQLNPRLVHSGGPHVVVGWHQTPGTDFIGAQALDASGARLWNVDGVEVLRGDLAVGGCDFASDGAGGLLATAADDRGGLGLDLFAQMINARGDYYTAEPTIESVADVPGDQGGWVRVTVGPSDRDDIAVIEQRVARYDVWQRIDAAAVSLLAQGATFVEKDGKRYLIGARGAVVPEGAWELLGSFAATQDTQYVYRAPTLGDSSLAGVPYQVYLVSAHTTDPAVWFASAPDSGYSVDNIAPSVPTSFAVAYNTGPGNHLTWDPCPDADFKYFRVYRSETSGFIPSPADYVYGTTGTEWMDPVADGWKYHYVITAVDMADNESDPTAGTETGVSDGNSPRQVTLAQNVPNPFNPSTVIAVGLPAAGHATLSIYDATGRRVRTLIDGALPAGFRSVAWRGVDDGGNPVSSGVYFYRLEAGGKTITRKMVLLK